MYVLRVWYKDGTKRDFYFDSEKEREVKRMTKDRFRYRIYDVEKKYVDNPELLKGVK